MKEEDGDDGDDDDEEEKDRTQITLPVCRTWWRSRLFVRIIYWGRLFLGARHPWHAGPGGSFARIPDVGHFNTPRRGGLTRSVWERGSLSVGHRDVQARAHTMGQRSNNTDLSLTKCDFISSSAYSAQSLDKTLFV